MAQSVEPDSPMLKMMRETFDEIKLLPPGWDVLIDSFNRISYKKLGNGYRTVDHPTLGPLPRDWIITMTHDPVKKGWKLAYFNQKTKESAEKDPRYSKESIRAHKAQVSKDHRDKHPVDRRIMETAQNIRAASRNEKMSDLRRAAISDVDLSHHYEYIYAIDYGSEIGGMNGGVFVVRSISTKKLLIEKKFSPKQDRSYCMNEIDILHKIKHGGLTAFISGYITPTKMAVYMEFCNLGSLGDLIKTYEDRRRNTVLANQGPRVPEKFIWHCFLGICQALAYMQTGLELKDIANETSKLPGWIPILHRDVKPDNILMSARTRVGSHKYPYVVLSDFGMACYDYRSGHPKENLGHKLGYQVGTAWWFAPELCYDPGPRVQGDLRFFPTGSRHSFKSDVWSLGAVMFNLAEMKYDAHLVDDKSSNDHGSISLSTRKKSTKIASYYHADLQTSIEQAMHKSLSARPTPARLAIDLRRRSLRLYDGDGSPANDEEKLPDWATTLHEYHSWPGLTVEDCIQKKLNMKAEKEAEKDRAWRAKLERERRERQDRDKYRR